MHRRNSQFTHRGRWFFPIGIAATALLLVSFACRSGNDGARSTGYRGTILPQPREKVNFTLTDTEGEPFDFVEATRGFVTLVFFGYTYCPDVCPIHMANIGAVLEDLPFETRRQIQVIFITTDPERDTPERLRAWLDNFDSSFVGLRGTREEVNQISVALGLPPSLIVEDDEGGYEVGHSAHVMAFTKDGLAHIIYPFGTRQADWAHDLPKLVDEMWGAER
jgi:protein SCO1/2